MSVQTGPEIIGFGAGALDVYRPKYNYQTEEELRQAVPDYVGGGKIGWTEHDDRELPRLIGQGCEQHIGGNDVNTLGYLAMRADGLQGKRVGLSSAVGKGDMSSEAIRLHLPVIGIEDRLSAHDNYLPSVSIIERHGSDRMVRGRPRTPLGDYISDEQIIADSKDAEIVVAASLKSPDLMDRLFEFAPRDALLSLNPGSTDLRDPQALLGTMQKRNPQLLALNVEELLELYGAKDGSPLPYLHHAIEVSENVLCTDGAKALYLARRGNNSRMHLDQLKVTPLPKEQVVDTLGAGDRSHAVAVAGLYAGKAGSVILQEIAESTRELIQHTGAHGDLYDLQDPRIQENRDITSRLPLS